MICVVDAGLENNPGHAHLGFSRTITAAHKNVRKAAKADMIKVFMEAGVLPLEECLAA
jgi:hypothetical protein